MPLKGEEIVECENDVVKEICLARELLSVLFQDSS